MGIDKPFDHDMPLIEMTEDQLQAVFDNMLSGHNAEHLKGVRAGEDQDILIAVAFLILKDGTKRIIRADCEYGDGESVDSLDDLLEELDRTGQLLKGELTERKVFLAKLPNVEASETPGTSRPAPSASPDQP